MKSSTTLFRFHTVGISYDGYSWTGRWISFKFYVQDVYILLWNYELVWPKLLFITENVSNEIILITMYIHVNFVSMIISLVFIDLTQLSRRILTCVEVYI